ncbi:hypothetical protein HZS_3587 [Henneguya salminicola]|nr:hypothetical protein HZS_3587 [Henneguya salminicola]
MSHMPHSLLFLKQITPFTEKKDTILCQYISWEWMRKYIARVATTKKQVSDISHVKACEIINKLKNLATSIAMNPNEINSRSNDPTLLLKRCLPFSQNSILSVFNYHSLYCPLFIHCYQIRILKTILFFSKIYGN